MSHYNFVLKEPGSGPASGLHLNPPWIRIPSEIPPPSPVFFHCKQYGKCWRNSISRFSCKIAVVGKVTLKSNGDEALSNDFLLKTNGAEALNDVFL